MQQGIHERTHPVTTAFCLETLSESVEYYKWIYELMRPHLGTHVVELGVGIGNLTIHLLRDERFVTGVDTDERMIHSHRSRISQSLQLHSECVSLHQLSLRPNYAGRFDSVVSSNVLEHVSDDLELEVVKASFDLLRPGGYSMHWVPAFQSIFGSLDRTFSHQRRYKRAQLRTLFKRAGFEILSCEHWNMIGFFGWWFAGRVLGATELSPRTVATFDRYAVPLVRRIEPWMWRPFGQSIFIVARRPL